MRLLVQQLTPANDNDPPLRKAFSLTEFASLLQLDEDKLLQRLARVLSTREA